MTVYYGVETTKAFVTKPAVKTKPSWGPTKMYCLVDVTDSVAFATTDSIKMFYIPKGALIHEVKVQNTDSSTNGAINVGWLASDELDSSGTTVEAANATGFFSALDVGGQADVTLMSIAAAAPAGQYKQMSGAVQLVIVPSTSFTSAATLTVSVEYSLA